MADFNEKFNELNNTPDTTAEFDPADVQANKAMGVLAYLSWLVLIPIFAAKNSRFARFHANQGIVLAIAWTAWWIVQAILGAIIGAIFVTRYYGIPVGVSDGMPFADEIAAFLTDAGYTCRRNVGASAYRMDIAVEKPGFPDILMAGIECDGPNYANARTARDRDVLRRGVMSSLGWRLYHVWAMGWFLNPENEKKSLLEFLDRCMKADAENTVPRRAAAAPTAQSIVVSGTDQMLDTEDRSADVHTLALDSYEYARPEAIQGEPGDSDLDLLDR
ncbi:MAG: hypothetical protein IK118_00195, partial [Clostridia bacterium]|nr:hypothetical protein [Clostridia bacterium]